MELETSWTLIVQAAGGNKAARAEFISRYEPFVRRVLAKHWRGLPIAIEIDDTLQNLWLECFQKNGVLERADPKRSFRAFLCGVVRREEHKVKQRWARDNLHRDAKTFHPEQVQDDDTSLSKILDREWAMQVMDEAWQLYGGQAREKGEAALHRLEVLRLRTRDNQPPREIAKVLGGDAAQISRDYAQARKEFELALRDVVGLHEGCTDEKLDGAAQHLFALLGARGNKNS